MLCFVITSIAGPETFRLRRGTSTLRLDRIRYGLLGPAIAPEEQIDESPATETLPARRELARANFVASLKIS